METKFQFTENSTIAKKIKKEVSLLNNKNVFKVNIRSRKGYTEPKDIFISYIPQYNEKLETAIEALRELKTYCKNLYDNILISSSCCS
jgi:hypothetical protein